MKGIVVRMVAGALLAWPAMVSAQQVMSPRPGEGVALPAHVQAQLWPERTLTPIEAELKRHVTDMTDSLVRFDATVALLERHRAAGASNALIRATVRSLGSDCARAGRTAVPVDAFAQTLTTDNPRWGDGALRSYRQALVTLRREMQGCSQSAETMAGTTREVPVSGAMSLASRATEAVRGYQRAEQGLLRTLRMETLPDRRNPAPGR